MTRAQITRLLVQHNNQFHKHALLHSIAIVKKDYHAANKAIEWMKLHKKAAERATKMRRKKFRIRS